MHILSDFQKQKNSLSDRTSGYKKNAYNVHVLLMHLLASDPKYQQNLVDVSHLVVDHVFNMAEL